MLLRNRELKKLCPTVISVCSLVRPVASVFVRLSDFSFVCLSLCPSVRLSACLTNYLKITQSYCVRTVSTSFNCSKTIRLYTILVNLLLYQVPKFFLKILLLTMFTGHWCTDLCWVFAISSFPIGWNWSEVW